MVTLLRFARRYQVPYLHWYVAGTVLLAATNWLSVTIPLYLAQGIDALATGQEGATAIALNAAAAVAGMGVLVIGVRTASRLLFFTPGRLVEAQVKHDLFARMLRHQPTFLERWPIGDLVSRLASDVNMVRLLAGFTAMGIINTTVAMVLAGTQMYRLSPTLAAWVIIPLLLGFLVTLSFVGRLRSIMQRMQEQGATLSDHVLSSYQGIATLQAFGAEAAMQERFHVLNVAYLRTTLQRANLRIVIGPVLALAASVNVFLLLYIGGPLAIGGDLTIGELVAFTTLVAYLTGPLRGLSFILSLFKQAQASLERIDAVLVPEPNRPDLPDPVAAPAVAPAITVQGLTFHYPGETDPTLHDVSLQVPASGTLGVFGPTGSGKTTLLRCIARLYNPPTGTVHIDDTDVVDLDLDGWRRTMAMVPQRAFLFSEPVKANILLGEPDNGRLQRILASAQLEVDMAALPDGVDTEVGEAGLTLSGGQRQRVALARGLARTQNIVLMLDDVLSAVDHHTEAGLIQALRAQANRPTTVIVANRLSAIQHADIIVVLDGGRVVDQGTHGELIGRPGLYRETWDRQSDGEE